MLSSVHSRRHQQKSTTDSAKPALSRSVNHPAISDYGQNKTTYPLQFGLANPDRFLPVSEGIFRVFTKGFFAKGGKALNLSLEDWASRSLTLIAINIPYTIRSVKEHFEVWETNIRNYATWFMTVALLSFTKNEKTSVNTLLNTLFMVPKLDLDKLKQDKKVDQRKIWTDSLNNSIRNEITNKYGNPFHPDEIKTSLNTIKQALRDRSRNPLEPLSYKDLFENKPYLDKLGIHLKALGLEGLTPNEFNQLSGDQLKKARRKFSGRFGLGGLNKQARKTLRKASRDMHITKRKLARLDREKYFESLNDSAKTGFKNRLKGIYYGTKHFIDRRLLNHLRLPHYYIDVLEANGFNPFSLGDKRVAAWSSFDGNQNSMIVETLQKLEQKKEKLLKTSPKGLLTEHEEKFLKLAPKLLRRKNIINAVSSIAYGLLGAYLMGTLIMRFVFKYITPLDHGTSPATVLKEAFSKTSLPLQAVQPSQQELTPVTPSPIQPNPHANFDSYLANLPANQFSATPHSEHSRPALNPAKAPSVQEGGWS